jgi:hypothetical protein
LFVFYFLLFAYFHEPEVTTESCIGLFSCGINHFSLLLILFLH